MGLLNWLKGRKPKASIEISKKEKSGQTEDEYYERCLKQEYFEENESRSWAINPEFRKILDPLNEGNNARACEESEKLVVEFPDFDVIYYWWGTALLRMRSYDKARQVLSEGLRKVKQKCFLCNVLGEVEWKSRNIKEAVYWWSQGLHCQESLPNHGGEVGAYLYFYYVADGIGLSDCASAFLLKADTIRSGQIRLNAQTAEDLRSLARPAKTSAIEKVVKELVSKYIVPARTSGKGINEEEVDRLICQLRKRSKSGWSSKENVEAAKKLGEIGDPKAIGPLMEAMQDIMIDLSEAAKEAIEKIKKVNMGK
jgi:hypothetical protein